jgi:hypothetical protein
MILIEELEMRNNYIETAQNVQYEQFVPHREQNTCSDDKEQLATELWMNLTHTSSTYTVKIASLDLEYLSNVLNF